jgi:hypothetical protein
MIKRNKIFVAGPFTVAINSKSYFDPKVRNRIEVINDIINSLGKEVFSSHKRENWGANLDVPESLAGIDKTELGQCSHLIVYWGSKISIGVSIEMGLAIALKKPILLIRDARSIKSDFYAGLVKLGYINELKWVDDEQIKKAIKSFLQ